MKLPWTYRVIHRKHNGQEIVFRFQGRDFMRREWYPPWRNEQERDNAKCIVANLNAAFKERNETCA